MARKVDKKWTNRENIFMHNNGMIVTTNYDSQSDQMGYLNISWLQVITQK